MPHWQTRRAVAALVVLLCLAGCGGSSSESNAEYPIVDPSAPVPRVEVPYGTGTASVAALPTTYEANPSASCERAPATFHDGSQPAQRLIVIPPKPGIRAVAVTKHTTRVAWWFRELPADCKPVVVVVAVRKGLDPAATPLTKQVEVHGLSGTTEISYPDFLPPPDVAWASAYSESGARGRSSSVLIERGANVSPDPTPPAQPVTAPAGEPIKCAGRATIVEDAAGDVLTHAVGSPPAPVAQMTPALAGIDITRAAVQVDGRTMCATFTFARPPGQPFRLTLTLRDTSTASCCASLEFRRSAGRLELGYRADPSVSELEPVSDAGAALRDNRLVITGTLPSPSSWPYQSHRMPSTQNVGWSVVSAYSPNTYGPSYGDWLPRHQATGEPIIRHSDGATVRPGVMP